MTRGFVAFQFHRRSQHRGSVVAGKRALSQGGGHRGARMRSALISALFTECITMKNLFQPSPNQRGFQAFPFTCRTSSCSVFKTDARSESWQAGPRSRYWLLGSNSGCHFEVVADTAHVPTPLMVLPASTRVGLSPIPQSVSQPRWQSPSRFPASEHYGGGKGCQQFGSGVGNSLQGSRRCRSSLPSDRKTWGLCIFSKWRSGTQLDVVPREPADP